MRVSDLGKGERGKGDGGWRDAITNIVIMARFTPTVQTPHIAKYTQQNYTYAANQNYCQYEYAYAPVKCMNNVTNNIPRLAGDRKINQQQVERGASHIAPWWQTKL